MAARRRRTPVRRGNVSQKTRSVGPSISGLSGSSDALGVRLRQAADEVAKGIRERASMFSKKIPPSVRVSQGDNTSAVVFTDAPNARPIELGLRHPLFGNRDYWYPSKHVKFMEEGADASAGKAADAIAKVIDDWAEELGYKK